MHLDDQDDDVELQPLVAPNAPIAKRRGMLPAPRQQNAKDGSATKSSANSERAHGQQLSAPPTAVPAATPPTINVWQQRAKEKEATPQSQAIDAPEEVNGPKQSHREHQGGAS